ncbi:PAS domain S-box protein [Tychonema sp. BBK16]|uniref:PAS domain S-box protein n=1 Tax=Tychonema sp. BBK16 TaxID=2699888 RepID=UPI001F2E4695|nr:PAS domain S-box protein [Tychonema sp. BBK16]MCF6375731.1 PAS domain S-box protein [Tychonema sp. BBK16]
MPEIPVQSVPLFLNSITQLEQAESALELAWEELEAQTSQIIDGLGQINPENSQTIGEKLAKFKQLRHQLKIKRKQAASRLEFHVANSPMAVIEWDSEFRVVRWSPMAEQIFGWKTAEIIGKYWHEWPIVYTEDFEQVKLVTNKLLDGSEPRNICHNRNYTKDGSVIHCEWNNSAQIDAAGKVVSILSFVLDVTERHRTQEELRRREQAFTALAENATDMIARCDRQLCHLYINQAVEAVTGKLRGEFIGKTNQESGMPTHFCNLWNEACLKVFGTGKQETIEFELSTPHGKKYYHCRVIPEFAEDNWVETVLVIARDITELKQTELQLRQSEAKFRTIVESNIIGIIYWDINGNITEANGAFLNTVDYTRDDLLSGRINWQEMTPPEYRSLDEEKLAELARNSKLLPFEKEYIRRDGSRVPVLLGAALSEGSQEFGVSFVLDLTDRKRAEESLKQQKELLQTIFDNVPVMIAFLGNSGEISWVNRHWEQVLGWSFAEIKDRDMLAEFYPQPEYRQQVLEFIQAATENGCDFKTKVRDGRIIDTSWANVRLSDGRYIGIGQDITDRKRVEAELKELNETLEAQVAQRTAELETFFDALPDRIFVVERENMRQPFVNKSVAKIAGFKSTKEMQGKTVFECFPTKLAEQFARENLHVFESGETLHFQEEFSFLDNKTTYFDTFKIPLRNVDGEIYALIGTSRDITELIETKQALSERTEQLEIANQELESFSYSVSHDLRAPLRHISGFVSALRQQLVARSVLDDRKIVHYMQVIEDSSQKMSLLIDGLLTLSRVGRTELIQIPIDLTDLVQTAIKLAQARTVVDLTQTLATAEFEIRYLPSVTGDPILLQQVLSNLISNAVKFSRGRNPAKIVIDSLPDGTIFVKDNGVGFEMEYADQLFGAFARLHSQREFEGTGIGLAIAWRIIQRHGGTIWAESAPDRGATFYFKLSK